MTIHEPITDLERKLGRQAGFSDAQILKARSMPGIVASAPDGDPAAGERSAEQRRLAREADRLTALLGEHSAELSSLEARLQAVRDRATSLAPQTETIKVLEQQISDCKKERARLELELAGVLDKLASPEEKQAARAGRLPLAQVVRARQMAKLDGPTLPPKMPTKPAEKLDFKKPADDVEIEIMRELNWNLERLYDEREKHGVEHIEWSDPKRDLRGTTRVVAKPGVSILAEARTSGLVPLANGALGFERGFIAELRAIERRARI